jgi:hypothetical protein
MTGQRSLVVGAALLFTLAGALWWRFGEAIFIERLMDSIMSCF